MLARNPALPTFVPPGPDNPLGIRALNLGWPSYRIHGTNDIRKIGRQSSSGCIGLFNEHILEVYDRAQIGTPVLVERGRDAPAGRPVRPLGRAVAVVARARSAFAGACRHRRREDRRAGCSFDNIGDLLPELRCFRRLKTRGKVG